MIERNALGVQEQNGKKSYTLLLARHILFFCIFAWFMVMHALQEDSKHSIYLVVTTALVDAHAQERCEEYEKSFMQFARLGYPEPFIVEGVASHGPTLLDHYTLPDHIYYYPHNKPADKNRGKFEGLSLAEALKIFQLPSHAYVYKQTGRYFATKDLATIVDEHPGFDAYVKRDAIHGYILLLAYVWKAEKLQKMFETLDYDRMEQEYDPTNVVPSMLETHVTAYVAQAEQQGTLKVFYIEEPLGVLVEPQYSSTGVPADSPTEY